MSDVTISWITCSSQEEAGRISEALVEEKLAACVNMIPGITSVFSWKGDICREQEILLMVKSVSSKQTALEGRIKTLHSYSTPEILTVSVNAGSRDYLEWVRKETS